VRPLLFVKAEAAERFGVGTKAVADAGADVTVWDAIGGEDRPSLDDVAGVVMFGSSFNVEHAGEQPFIHELSRFTAEALDRNVPYLGICFGAQILAWTLGSEIRKADRREIGYVEVHPLPDAAGDPLLSAIDDGERMFQWHMDTYDLPAGAELLVKGDTVVNQAYRVGDATWGTQFHLEIDLPEIEMWADDAADALEAEWGTTPDELLAQAAEHHERHERLGAELFRRFAAVARSRA
jgi:GMP synthase (glutamine-hydrolysing)